MIMGRCLQIISVLDFRKDLSDMILNKKAVALTLSLHRKSLILQPCVYKATMSFDRL